MYFPFNFISVLKYLNIYACLLGTSCVFTLHLGGCWYFFCINTSFWYISSVSLFVSFHTGKVIFHDFRAVIMEYWRIVAHKMQLNLKMCNNFKDLHNFFICWTRTMNHFVNIQSYFNILYLTLVFSGSSTSTPSRDMYMAAILSRAWWSVSEVKILTKVSRSTVDFSGLMDFKVSLTLNRKKKTTLTHTMLK